MRKMFIANSGKAKNLFSLALFMIPLVLQAQFGSSNVYLAGMYSMGKINVKESIVGGPSPTADYAELNAEFRPLAFTMTAQGYGENKFNIRLYSGFTLGAGSTNYIYNITQSPANNPKSDFNALLDLRFGPQFTYVNTDKEYLFGIRYFYWINADGLRSYEGESDDGAAIGVCGAYKNFGIDVNYAPKGLIGIKVDNSWNILQVETRYQAYIFSDDSYSLVLGIRYEHSSWKNRETYTGFGFLGYNNSVASSVGFLLGIGM
jgi:hypothetical protein